MAEEEAPPSSSNSNSRYLHSKIRIKSSISDLANLVGEITEVKRGGWFMTDNPKIVRPIRAREFDLVVDGEEKGGDDNEGETKDGEEGVIIIRHFSAGKKEEGDEEEEELSDEEKVNPEDSNNYDKDQFLQLGTTIKITSGEHKGRTCTISERRVGIFLKIAVGGDIRLMQPDEIEVIKFADYPPSEEEEEKKSGKKEKDFGHKKYIGASVRVAGAAGEPGRKQRGKEATVDNAFLGEWYLVSDPDIVKALDPAQFEVVTKVKGGKRKRDDDDYDSDEEEEEEEDEDFLSNMQFCGEASAEKPKKSLRTREKKVNYNENGESSDDMESWQDSEEEKEEKQKGKKKEEEVEDESDDASFASVRKDKIDHPVLTLIPYTSEGEQPGGKMSWSTSPPTLCLQLCVGEDNIAVDEETICNFYIAAKERKVDGNNSHTVQVCLGRNETTQIQWNRISRELCDVGVTREGNEGNTNVTAWMKMKKLADEHNVHLNRRKVMTSPGEKIEVNDGSIIALFGEIGYAYRVQIVNRSDRKRGSDGDDVDMSDDSDESEIEEQGNEEAQYDENETKRRKIKMSHQKVPS